MSIQAIEMLQLLATDAAKAGNEWDIYFQEPLDPPVSSLFVNVLCRCISFIQFSLHPRLWQLAALSLSISRRLFRAACSLICWLPSVMSFSLHGGGTLLSLFYRFLLVSLFSFFFAFSLCLSIILKDCCISPFLLLFLLHISSFPLSRQR